VKRGLVCICAILCAACAPQKTEAGLDRVSLPPFGVSLQMPRGFKPVPPERLRDMETPAALAAEPFTAVPHRGYADSAGRGIVIISELRFTEGLTPEKYPLDNLYLYQKNLEALLGAGEITSEEIGGDISTVLMGMTFTEGESEISLFKGLCYKYPDVFFMIDLYAVNAKITREDALEFQNMFNSIGLP
jgi:hypothetical protein